MRQSFRKCAYIGLALFSLACIFFKPSFVHAAEVYYLGSNDQTGGEKAKPASNYTLQQRAKDLFDFGAYGDYSKDRSGQITGSVLAEVDATKISGNREKSFYKEGADYLTEYNINAYEKLWRDYRFEAQTFLRKTDDRRIEPRRDLRLKQLSTRISNSNNMLEFGDMYAEFSPFTLGSSLEGFNADMKPHRLFRVKGVAARKNRSDVTTNQFQRNVFGGKVDFLPFAESSLFSLFRIGAQAVTTQDDSSTKVADPDATDLDNTVYGLDGEMTMRKFFSLAWEWAQSLYRQNADESGADNAGTRDRKLGTAFKIQPGLNFGNILITKYLFYYVQPNFYTDVGSASWDKMQHQFNVDVAFNPWLRLALIENWYWDHLNKSQRTYRTLNDEKYATFYIKPLEDHKDLFLRPYVNYLVRRSDDPPDVLKADTTTVGFAINDNWKKTAWSTRYEYRAFDDQSTKAGSDYFNRFGFMVSRDMQIFKRRFYASVDTNMDFRNSKSEDDDDIATGVSANGQYDIFERLVFRFGYNLQNMAAGTPMAGYLNTRNFCELDLRLNRKRNAHFLTRVERNVYNHQDGTQDYKETRVVSKVMSQF